MPEVKLTEQELDVALTLIEEHGCSAFFPHPFEIAAIRACWDKIRPVLERVELLSYIPREAYMLISPKQKYVVRPIHLLDPIDAILFMGLAWRLAPLAEAKRISPSDEVVYSFRLQSQGTGIPSVINEWNAYIQKIESKSRDCKMVATADIVDFFPRIYLHRLENAIAAVTEAKYETRAIMRLLEGWSEGTSFGIPIGPIASNLLAEVLLVEVDDYLMHQGIDFVRFVDDYIIFANSEAECAKGLFLLGSRLQETQRLSLNMAKTRIMTSSDLHMQLAKPKDADKILRQKIIEKVFRGDPYAEVDYEKLSEEQKGLIDQLDAKQTIEQALAGDVADLTAIRFMLNVLSALRRPELIDPVLDNLPRLSPVSDAVARFLNVFDKVTAADRTKIGQRILAYLQEADFIPDFQSLWLLEPFANSREWDNIANLRSIAREHENRFVRRQAILALGQIGERSALLDVKSSLTDAKDWEWRAIIFACRNLPRDERDAFYQSIPVGGDWRLDNLITKAIIQYSKQVSRS